MKRFVYHMGFNPALFGSRMRDCLQQLLKNAQRDYVPSLIGEFDGLEEGSWNDAVVVSLTQSGEATIKLSTIVDSSDCAVNTLKCIVKATAVKLKRDLKSNFADSKRPEGFTDDELEFVLEALSEDSAAFARVPAKMRRPDEIRKLSGAYKMNPFAVTANRIVSDECIRLKAEMDAKVKELEKQIELVKDEYKRKIEALQRKRA